MTKVIGYVRVSTDEQIDGVSLDLQRAKISAYCSLYDLEVVRVEVDPGLSAKTLKRPALQRVLASLRAGEADALIVAKLDRLTRRTRDLLELVERYFADGKRSLLSVHEQIDTRTSAGRMILTVLGALAQFEREQIGDRVRDALAHKRARGERVGSVPLGFALVDGALVPDQREQLAVTTARSLRAHGLSYRAIASALDEGGHRTRTGRAWHPSQVARMVV